MTDENTLDSLLKDIESIKKERENKLRVNLVYKMEQKAPSIKEILQQMSSTFTKNYPNFLGQIETKIWWETNDGVPVQDYSIWDLESSLLVINYHLDIQATELICLRTIAPTLQIPSTDFQLVYQDRVLDLVEDVCWRNYNASDYVRLVEAIHNAHLKINNSAPALSPEANLQEQITLLFNLYSNYEKIESSEHFLPAQEFIKQFLARFHYCTNGVLEILGLQIEHKIRFDPVSLGGSKNWHVLFYVEFGDFLLTIRDFTTTKIDPRSQNSATTLESDLAQLELHKLIDGREIKIAKGELHLRTNCNTIDNSIALLRILNRPEITYQRAMDCERTTMQ